MALQAGTRLGPYEVVSLVGAGGMGEVYRARDTRLGRTVAIKVLPPDVPAEFRARFEREARAISALNHPHICSLYDVGRDGGVEYLVLELVEGETLASRLERGPLPLDHVLRLGIEIAEALAAAHRHGIVHRDLKPSNVMITAVGAKLLDFGLAKYAPGAATTSSAIETATWSGTALGTVIGTLPYMAPEQVRGLPADARTDIFALGTLLHEMATGRRAFEAITQASLVAEILTADVPAVSTFARASPPAFDHIVERCLAKEPADRWDTAHDVELQLQWVRSQEEWAGRATAAAKGGGRRAWVPWVLAAVALAALLGTALRTPAHRDPPPAVPVRFDVPLPRGMRVSLAYDRAEISPDGRKVVFSASMKLRPQLFVRELGSTEITPLDDTESGFFPSWSPNGRSVAFFANGKLKRISLAGGPARVLADATGWSRAFTGSGTWADGTILFALADGSVVRVPDTGGTPTRVETLRGRDAGAAFSSPRFLPGGRRFLVSRARDPGLFVASLDSDGPRRIAEDGSGGVYAAGRVMYLRGSSLFARPFDPARLVFTGAEALVARQVATFSASENGTVAYVPARVALSRLTWFDRHGGRSGVLGDPGPYTQVVLSPRGRRATLVRIETQDFSYRLFDSDLWDVDLASGVQSGLTREPGFIPVAGDHEPRLLLETPYIVDEVRVSPDGGWVAYDANESGRWEVYVARFPDFTSKRQVSRDGGVQPQWSGDGRELFYLSGDGSMTSVRVTPGRDLATAVPTRLFSARLDSTPHVPIYAVSADGQRFLALEGPRGRGRA